MAIEYTIYSALELADLEMLLNAAAEAAGDLWEIWGANDNLGPFHAEIMESYGVEAEFKCYCLTRHSKEESVEAREYLYGFFESLPGPRLLLKDDVFIAFRPE
jgi:hypothetical protein